MGQMTNPLEACKADLFTDEDELRERYAPAVAERVMRIREMYNTWLANPSMKDRDLVGQMCSRHNVKKSTAYADLGIIRQLVPLIASQSQDYKRAKANEMIMETYAMAKARKDTKVMAQCVANYTKANGLDKPDDYAPQYELIPIIPWCATTDPSVLGIKPIPNLQQKIAQLTKELTRDFPDIEDVEWEDPDLEEQFLFPTNNEQV